MATYLNYGAPRKGTRCNTGTVNITDFDYQNNKLFVVCGYQGGYQATVTNSTRDSYWPRYSSQWSAGLYTCSSSSITMTRTVSTTYWGYYIIPNETTITYLGDDNGNVSATTVNLSNIDYDNNDVYIIHPASITSSVTDATTDITFIQNLYYASQGNCVLYKVTPGVSSLALKASSYSGPCFEIVMPKQKITLQVGDVLNYTDSPAVVDLTGYQFTCRLKGSTVTRSSGSSTYYAYGANCYAEFNFSSVSDGNVTIGNNYGSYIALTNGTVTDIRYKRIMVAGDGGGSTSGSDSTNVSGGNAGLFGGSGETGKYGGASSASSTQAGKGGTQSAGGAKGTYSGNFTSAQTDGGFGISGSGSYNYVSYSGYSYYGGAGGNGWYGGGGGVNVASGLKTGGGGGSSYLLTDTSYKPTGYFPEWTTYQPLISNGTSALLSGTRDYYATITILALPPVGPVLPDPSILQRYNATSDQFDPCNIYILKKDITEFETTDLATPVISQKPSDSSYSPDASTLTPSVGTEELKFASGTFTNTLSVVGSDYSSKTITTDKIYATFTIPLGTSKCYAQMSSSVPSPYCGYTLKVYNGSTFDTIVDNDRHTTPIDITSSISVGTTNLFEFSVSMSGSYEFDSASDYMKLVLLPETGETNTFQVCALYRYDSTNDEFVKIGG